MQRSTILFLILAPVLPAGWPLAGLDPQTSSSGVTQKKTKEWNGADKKRQGPGQATGSGVVSGLAVGGNRNSTSNVKVSAGAALDRNGRNVSPGRKPLPDPRKGQ